MSVVCVRADRGCWRPYREALQHNIWGERHWSGICGCGNLVQESGSEKEKGDLSCVCGSHSPVVIQ